MLRQANAISFGTGQLPTFDFANSRYVLNFGADVLGTWNSPVSHARAYGEMRQGRVGVRGRLVQLESRMSQTGASADEWVPVRPGTEGVLALGLAHLILREKTGAAATAGSPRGVADQWLGCGAARLHAGRRREGDGRDRFASRTTCTRLRPCCSAPRRSAVIGGAALAHTNGLFNALAVNALNALVGSVGSRAGCFSRHSWMCAAAAKLSCRARRHARSSSSRRSCCRNRRRDARTAARWG